MKIKRIIAAALFAAVAFFAAGVGSSEASDGLNEPLTLKWVTQLKKEKIITRKPYQFASPILDGENLYVGVARGRFYSIETKKGRKNWEVELEGGVYADAAFDDENIYVADRKGVVYSIAKKDGKINWKTESGGEVSATPMLHGENVLVVTTLRQLVALDKASGALKWVTTKSGTQPQMTIKESSTPVIYNGKIYLGYSDGSVSCLDPSDGAVIWSRDVANKSARFTDMDSSPLFVNGVMVISGADGNTYALDPNDGSKVWTVAHGGANDVVTDGKFLFVAGGGYVAAVDPGSGGIIWEQQFKDSAELSTPSVGNGFLVVFGTEGHMYTLDSLSGKVKSKRYLGKGTFGRGTVYDKRLFVLTNSSRLFYFQGK